MADPRLKTLKIKTGVVKRLTKDKTEYEKEVDEEKARLEKFKSQGKDVYVLRKQEEVIQETIMMIPDTQRRLAAAYQDLQKLIDSEKDLQTLEEYQIAIDILKEAAKHLPESA